MFAKKSKNIFVALFFIFALVVSAIIGTINLTTPSTHAINSSNSFLRVDFVQDGQVTVPTDQLNYEYAQGQFADAYAYKASKVDFIKFYFDFSSYAGPAPTIDTKGTSLTGDDTYKINIEVEYLQGYKNDDNTYFADGSGLHAEVVVNKTMQKECSISKDWKSEFSQTSSPLTWKIHDNNVGQSASGPKTFSGWGIYRFKVIVGSNISYTDFFILQPTMQVTTDLIVTVNNEDIEKAVYQVVPVGDYKHIDPSQITWYVYGKADNEKNYALLEEDLATNKFQLLECTEYLHKKLPRTGYTFSLPRPTIEGDWIVWCEYVPYGMNIAPEKSEEFHIITSGEVPTFPYWWIVIGACVLGLGVTLLVATIRNKHEKIF